MDSPGIAPFRADTKPRAVWPAGLEHLEPLNFGGIAGASPPLCIVQSVKPQRRPPVDCRSCRHQLHRRCHRPSKCTAGDQFEPLEPLQLWADEA